MPIGWYMTYANAFK